MSFSSSVTANESDLVRRTSVIGITGSGKSYFASRLAVATNLPLVELDRMRTDLGEVDSFSTTFVEAVKDRSKEPEWIIEGHYRSVRHEIWSRADEIVWLDPPLLLVGYQLFRRRINASRSARVNDPDAFGEDAGSGPKQSIWQRRAGRWTRAWTERKQFAVLLTNPEYAQARIVRLRTRAQMACWLAAAAARVHRSSSGTS